MDTVGHGFALGGFLSSRGGERRSERGSWPSIFPDYAGVTIPVGIAPLNFACSGEAERMDVVLKGAWEAGCMCRANMRPLMPVNGTLVDSNKGGKLVCTVCIKSAGTWSRYRDFDIYISDYALDDYGLTYRKIAPGYEVYSKMGLYERAD